MNKKLLSLALALSLALTLIPIASAEEKPTRDLFDIKFELEINETSSLRSTLLFTEQPTGIVFTDAAYKGVGLVFPLGTIIAFERNGELLPIFLKTENGKYDNELINTVAYGRVLTEEMNEQTKGVRVVEPVSGHGLMTIFAGYEPEDTLPYDEYSTLYCDIPDPNFEAALFFVQPMTGPILQKRAAMITDMGVHGRNISDLTGIEYFTALEKFGCENNRLTTIDISSNTALIKLTCDNNYFTDKTDIIGLDETRTTVTFDPQKTVPNISTADSWAQRDITVAIAKGLVPNSLQNSYTNATTRAEFAALAVTLYETITGKKITVGSNPFTDTNDINVRKAVAIKVVNGVGDNKFDPDGKLNREQAATMLSRLADAIGKPLPKQASTFTDNESISPYASDAVGQMQATGVMGGTGNNTFAPKDDYKREQSIVTILRLYDIVKM